MQAVLQLPNPIISFFLRVSMPGFFSLHPSGVSIFHRRVDSVHKMRNIILYSVDSSGRNRRPCVRDRGVVHIAAGVRAMKGSGCSSAYGLALRAVTKYLCISLSRWASRNVPIGKLLVIVIYSCNVEIVFFATRNQELTHGIHCCVAPELWRFVY